MQGLLKPHNTLQPPQRMTHPMVIEHKLHSIELDEFAYAAITDGQVVQQLQRPRNYWLRAAPVLQIGYTVQHAAYQHYIMSQVFGEEKG